MQKTFRTLGFGYLVLRYSTNPERLLARKLQIVLDRCALLETNGENGILRSSRWRKSEDFSLMSYCESVRSLGSGPGQQQLVSTEAIVDGTVLDVKRNDEEKSLCSFGISISLVIFFANLDYRPLSGNSDTVEGSMMQLAGIHAFVGTVLTCLRQSEKCGGRRQIV